MNKTIQSFILIISVTWNQYNPIWYLVLNYQVLEQLKFHSYLQDSSYEESRMIKITLFCVSYAWWIKVNFKLDINVEYLKNALRNMLLIKYKIR